ncbi:MAG: tryptophanase [Candidatus Freyarchaeota archaeon]
MDFDRDRRRKAFKIKVVQPIKWNTREERAKIMEAAGYCFGFVRAEDIPINLTTDSGTSAMSMAQWSALMDADEAYFNRKNFYDFEKAVKDFTGMKYILPTHQGRAAEHIVCAVLIKHKGSVIPANAHFGTTEIHAMRYGARPVNLPIEEALDSQKIYPFKGNIDINKFEELISKKGAENIPFLNMVMTNNFMAGQPVSMANLKEAAEIAHEHGIKVVIDAARLPENAYFIKERESGYKNKSIREICREACSYADVVHMSCKKCALVNMGGFIATNDEDLYMEMGALLVQFEGYLTYGGLTGRDLAAIAVGLNEGLDYDYLADRIGQVEYFAEQLRRRNVPIYEPPGGHAVYVDAERAYPHIPKEQYPAEALGVESYIEGGVAALGHPSSLGWTRTDPETGKPVPCPFEFTRYAIPRRVYFDCQLEYAADVIAYAVEKGEKVKGFRVKWVPKNEFLRVFIHRLERIK